MPVLLRLGPGCAKLSLDCERLQIESLSEDFLVHRPQLSKQLTHLKMCSIKWDFFQFVCSTFSALTHLDVSLFGLEYVS